MFLSGLFQRNRLGTDYGIILCLLILSPVTRVILIRVLSIRSPSFTMASLMGHLSQVRQTLSLILNFTAIP